MKPIIDTELLRKTIRRLKSIGIGIDPITDFEYDDYVLFYLKENHELFIDAIVYLSILDSIYSDNGQIDVPFFVKAKELFLLEAFPDVVKISEFTDYINSVISRPGMKKLKTTQITNWLVEQEMLKIIEDDDGKMKKVVDKKGWMIGIRTVKMRSDKGIIYPVNLYSPQAQNYIIGHLIQICEDISF